MELRTFFNFSTFIFSVQKMSREFLNSEYLFSSRILNEYAVLNAFSFCISFWCRNRALFARHFKKFLKQILARPTTEHAAVRATSWTFIAQRFFRARFTK